MWLLARRWRAPCPALDMGWVRVSRNPPGAVIAPNPTQTLIETAAACHCRLGSSNGNGDRAAATDEPSSAPLSGLTFQLSPHLTKEQADEAVYWVNLCGGRLLTPRAGREEAVRAHLSLSHLSQTPNWPEPRPDLGLNTVVGVSSTAMMSAFGCLLSAAAAGATAKRCFLTLPCC